MKTAPKRIPRLLLLGMCGWFAASSLSAAEPARAKLRAAMMKEMQAAKTDADKLAIRKKYRALLAGTKTRVEMKDPEESAPTPTSVTDEYAKLALSFGEQKEEPKEVIYYDCKHIRSQTMRRIIENFLTTSGTVADVEETDMVVISDVKSNIKTLQQIAQRVDRRVPQILVEAQIVELTLDDDFQKEIKLAFRHSPFTGSSFIQSIFTNLTPPGIGTALNPAPTNTTAFPTGVQGGQFNLRPYIRRYSSGKTNDLNLFIRYLETKGKAKILSAPNLILRRGSEGSIITGEEVPIVQQTAASAGISTSIEFKDVGISLDLKPIMITGGTVRLSVNPKVSTVTGFTQGSVPNPIIAKREALTELEVKDGELITIGGLLQSEERTTKTRVPIVGSVPILGHLFRGTRIENVKTQLVFFIRIRILEEGKVNGTRIIHPDDLPHPVQHEIKRMGDDAKPKKAQILRDIDSFRKGDQP